MNHEQPVLVRIRKTDIYRVDFVIEANLDSYPQYDDESANNTSNDTPVTNELADRVQAIQDIVNNTDFEPSDIDNNELHDLVDQTEGDAVLSSQMDAILATYQDKRVAISIAALNNLAAS